MLGSFLIRRSLFVKRGDCRILDADIGGGTLGLESIGHMGCVYYRDGVCVLPLSFKGHHSADKDLGRGVV